MAECQILIPGTSKCYFIRQKDFCRGDETQEAGMGWLFWIIHVGANSNHKRLYKREAEEDFICTEKKAT